MLVVYICRRLPLLSLSHGEVITCLTSHADETVILLLLPEVLVVVDGRENYQQQAFALSEIDCVRSQEKEDGHHIMQIFLTGVQNQHHLQVQRYLFL